ncbi:MAG: hypothetical protein K2J20_04045, partial [Bacilli bacterium]|nr:hypothetical protein [Bacilli bacterium]
MRIYLKHCVRNKEYYCEYFSFDLFSSNLKWLSFDVFVGCVLAAALFFAWGLTWIAVSFPLAIGGVSFASFLSSSIYYNLTSAAKSEKEFNSRIQKMQETISKVNSIDSEKALDLEVDEAADTFIRDIHKLMDIAIESGYDNYLNDCAILRQLEMRNLGVKKSLKDGSEASIMAKFPMFYKIQGNMQMQIEEKVARAKNYNVNTRAATAFLDSRGLVFSEEMLERASQEIDKLATATVGDPEVEGFGFTSSLGR